MNIDTMLQGYAPYTHTGKEQSSVGIAIHDFIEPQGKKKGFEAHGHGTPDSKGGLDLFSCTREDLLDTLRKVMAQYGGRVGTFYSMKQCSLWIALAIANNKIPGGMTAEAIEASHKALAVCGSLYEDLGLAGYNPKAEAFDNCLLPILKIEGVVRVRGCESDPLKRLVAFTSLTALKEKVKAGSETEDASDRFFVHERGMQVLLKECLGLEVDERTCRLVIRARQVGLCYGALERGKTKPSYGFVDFLGKPLSEFAAIVGTMRRAAKGKLASDSSIDEIVEFLIDEDSYEDVRKALPQLVEDDVVKFYFGKSAPVTGMVFRAKNMMLGALNAKVNERIRSDEYWEN